MAMLTKLGKRTPETPGLSERLLDCHARIRHFCAVAERLAGGASGEEARQAATELVRYFAVALPLHVADEEQSLMPRLVAIVDGEALAVMQREHAEADARLAELVARWQDIAAAPTPERALATATAAAGLHAHFDAHLAAEETRIFPLLVRLDQREAEAIVAEMRARRQ